MGDCEAVIGLDGRKEERQRVSQRQKIYKTNKVYQDKKREKKTRPKTKAKRTLYHLLNSFLSSSKLSYYRMAVRRDQGIETDARYLSFLIVFTIVIFVVLVIFILFF